MTARWDGAPDQGLLQKKGGRGFPYATLMDKDGEVVWEVRPTSKEVFEKAVADAKMLVALRTKLAAKPDDKALAASVKILDAMGRNQREAPPLADVEAAAKVEGVDKDVLKRFEAWVLDARVMEAFQASRRDGGKAVYDLWKKGVKPGDDMLAGFYYYATNGAMKAENAADAGKLVDLFEAQAVKDAGDSEEGQKRAKEFAKRLRDKIAEMGGDKEDGDDGDDG